MPDAQVPAIPHAGHKALVERIAREVFAESPKRRDLLFFLFERGAAPAAQNQADVAGAFYAASDSKSTKESLHDRYRTLLGRVRHDLTGFYQSEKGRGEAVKISADTLRHCLVFTGEGSLGVALPLLRSLHGGHGPLVVAYTDIVQYFDPKTQRLSDGSGRTQARKTEVEQRFAVGRGELEAVALLWDRFYEERDRVIPHELKRSRLPDLRDTLTKSSVIFLGSPFDRDNSASVFLEDMDPKPLYSFRVRRQQNKVDLMRTVGRQQLVEGTTAMFGLADKEFAIVRRARTRHGTDLLLLAGTDTTSTLDAVQLLFQTKPAQLPFLREILGKQLDPDVFFECALELSSHGQVPSITKIIPS